MRKFAILVLTLTASTVAAAESSTPTLDPNEVICQTVRVTGSRLAVSRRCATRAQWLEEQRQQRTQLADRTLRQTQPGSMTPVDRLRGFGRSTDISIGGRPTD